MYIYAHMCTIQHKILVAENFGGLLPKNILVVLSSKSTKIKLLADKNWLNGHVLLNVPKFFAVIVNYMLYNVTK